SSTDTPTAEVEAFFADPDMNVGSSEKLHLPIVRQAPPAIKLKRETGIALNGSVFHAGPALSTPVIARAQGSVKLAITGEANGFARVDVGNGRPAWIARSAVLKDAAASGNLVFETNETAPELNVNLANLLTTRDPNLDVKGSARDDQQVRDVYIYADN